MLKYCLDKWDENKNLLKDKLKTVDLNRCEYLDLVRLVVDYILNPGESKYGKWNSKEITVVDNGDYQGTQLFLFHANSYQPCEWDYLMTYVGYGSCSGCDTLLAIQGWDDKPVTEKQVKDFMALCKDLVTNIVKPYNGGWRHREGFDEVTIDEER